MKDPPIAHAVMVIDMQRTFVERPGAIPRIGTILPAAQTQVEAARAAGALVVFVQNDGAAGEPDQPETAGWRLAIEPQPGDAVVGKKQDNGFVETDLNSLFRDHHVKTMSICVDCSRANRSGCAIDQHTMTLVDLGLADEREGIVHLRCLRQPQRKG